MNINLKNISVYWYQIAIAILLILLVIIKIDSCNKLKNVQKQNVQLVNSINDTLHTVIHKDSSQTASISTIQTPTVKDFTELNIANAEIKRLQALVSANKNKLKPGSSVSIGSVETDINKIGKTTVTYTDTIKTKEAVYIYPTYTDTIDDKWMHLDAEMTQDSSTFHVQIYNNFSAVVGYDKGKPYASITTDNPYSSVKSLRTYQVAIPPAKKWGVGISAGVTLNSNYKPAPYIGIGITRAIIRF